MANTEFDLIARIRARTVDRADVVLGIGDDAAVVRVPAGYELVVSADTLNQGVHFADATAPADIGWKALAVNLSDLAAMGAAPAWCTLSLSMPAADPDWVDAFLDGFLSLAEQQGTGLVGGDTTHGPLSISVTAMGLVSAGSALRRDRARIGDDIWVTGTLGDAAAALALQLQGAAVPSVLQHRLDRPTPRVTAGLALSGLAHACIDLSDGLLADLGHVCERSGVGAQIDLGALPLSTALAGYPAVQRWPWQTAGGDDYELCFTASRLACDSVQQAMDSVDLQATRIGRIVAGQGVVALDTQGAAWQPSRSGYTHFSPA